MPHAQKACKKKEMKKRDRERCIPKEGMPHAHKACQKKDAYPKKVCHMPRRHDKKKKKKKI